MDEVAGMGVADSSHSLSLQGVHKPHFSILSIPKVTDRDQHPGLTRAVPVIVLKVMPPSDLD